MRFVYAKLSRILLTSEERIGNSDPSYVLITSNDISGKRSYNLVLNHDSSCHTMVHNCFERNNTFSVLTEVRFNFWWD